MAFRSKITCLVLNSLDGHETSRQATDLDDNFGTPMVFDADSENRNPEAALLGWAIDFLGIYVVYGDCQIPYKPSINPV